jgi:siroheme synthase-like protein
MDSKAEINDPNRQGDPIMSLRLGDTAPDFQAETTSGPISFHDWLGDSWAALFSHPRDFTPVCTTELGYVARLKPELDKRGVKAIGLSIDPVTSHQGWLADIKETQGYAVNFPIIADPDRKVAGLYGMIHPAHDEVYTVRTVFVIDPKKKIRLFITYPQTTGRNFDEILRVIDSLQLTDGHRVATPVNWKPGEDVIIVPAVTDEEARAKFPRGWRALKPYLRSRPSPSRPSADMSAYYPVFLDLTDGPVLVVGGGSVAEGKVEGLLAAGANVTVVSPTVTPRLAGWVAAGRIEYLARAYQPGDLAGRRLALVATDDPAVSGAVAAEGRERGIWVNAADEPARCDFILPAVIRRGRLVVAVSTGGASPAAARAIREELEGHLTEEHAMLVEVAADAREDLRRRAVSPGPARWRGALDAGLRRLIADKRYRQARARLARNLESA